MQNIRHLVDKTCGTNRQGIPYRRQSSPVRPFTSVGTFIFMGPSPPKILGKTTALTTAN